MSISGMKDELYALERFYEHSSMDKPVDLVVALRKAIQDIEKYHEREARTKKPQVKSYCGGVPNYCTPEETPEVPCKTHPDAPHGFNRNASHNLGRYVCECEHWTPVDGVYMSQERVDETAKGGHEPVAWADKVGAVIPHSHKLFQPALLKDYTRPLYTAPPKRQWVGMTEDDVHDAFNYVEMVKLLDFDRDRPEWCEAFASACEARLRHKNGGNK